MHLHDTIPCDKTHIYPVGPKCLRPLEKLFLFCNSNLPLFTTTNYVIGIINTNFSVSWYLVHSTFGLNDNSIWVVLKHDDHVLKRDAKKCRASCASMQARSRNMLKCHSFIIWLVIFRLNNVGCEVFLFYIIAIFLNPQTRFISY